MTEAETVTRAILGNVPGWMTALFYSAVAAACAFAALVFHLRIRRYRQGKPGGPGDRPRRSLPAALASVAAYLASHRQLLRDPKAGVAHLLLFYGLLILFVGTCLVFLEHDTPLHFFYGWFYRIASLVIDLGGVLFLAGLALFLQRRFESGPHRFLRRWWVEALLWLLLLIGVTGFLLEGLRIARDLPDFERWSFVGYGLALGMRAAGLGIDTAALLHRVLWASHAALCIVFFALLPWRFFSHAAYAAASWALRTTRPIAQMRAPPRPEARPGAVTWPDLTRVDLLQADACTTCGRCNEVCPARAAGKPLSPREVVLGLRAALDAPAGPGQHPTPLSLFVPDEAIWSCTTCGACNHACPVGIEVYDKIVEVRRGRVETGIVPDAAESVFESSAAGRNPFQKHQEARLAWASGIPLRVAQPREPIPLLYWIGCAGSFDPDGQAVSRALTRILNGLGEDYRVLGNREGCTGDPARRLGEEGLFRELAQETLALFHEHSVRRVLTHCPHCFNAFRNEYPALDGFRFEVEHHSQYLARAIRTGRLKLPGGFPEKVTFHDPCYLGRGNGETLAPRLVLQSLPGLDLVEMERHGDRSFCCGAGGGSLWLDLKGRTRVESLRAREAAETGAATLATGCPYCKGMLEAGRQSLDDSGRHFRVRDLAELVVEAAGIR
ncbi:MAG: (Fe-S)-binding protein [Planctomycetes bacterium]|nr:(Fe-S)-binding protein [Planctomycetota bacterium]